MCVFIALQITEFLAREMTNGAVGEILIVDLFFYLSIQAI
jgi:hypothetical protein